LYEVHEMNAYVGGLAYDPSVHTFHPRNNFTNFGYVLVYIAAT